MLSIIHDGRTMSTSARFFNDATLTRPEESQLGKMLYSTKQELASVGYAHGVWRSMVALEYFTPIGFDNLLKLGLGFFGFQGFAHDVYSLNQNRLPGSPCS